jgi:hypothetical protein
MPNAALAEEQSERRPADTHRGCGEFTSKKQSGAIRRIRRRTCEFSSKKRRVFITAGLYQSASTMRDRPRCITS